MRIFLSITPINWTLSNNKNVSTKVDKNLKKVLKNCMKSWDKNSCQQKKWSFNSFLQILISSFIIQILKIASRFANTVYKIMKMKINKLLLLNLIKKHFSIFQYFQPNLIQLLKVLKGNRKSSAKTWSKKMNKRDNLGRNLKNL